MLKLFYAAGTCALASHITLAESGAAYTVERLDFKTEDQRKPDYLAINPKGRVPALLTAHGPLTETPAILAYIAQAHPAAKLAPLDDPFAFARVQAFNNYLCSTVHVTHAHGPRAYRWADDAEAQASMKRKVRENMLANFELIEPMLAHGPWVMGEAYSICDPYLYTISRWLEPDGVDLALLPRVQAHRERMAARPAVRRALEEEALPA